jgi:hypothetical protein
MQLTMDNLPGFAALPGLQPYSRRDMASQLFHFLFKKLTLGDYRIVIRCVDLLRLSSNLDDQLVNVFGRSVKSVVTGRWAIKSFQSRDSKLRDRI